MDKCAPNYSNSTISCFPQNTLIFIINKYNQNNPSDLIKYSKSDSKKDLWEAIQNKLRVKCGDNESCWLNQPFLRSHPDLEQYFKPLAPLGQYQWLATDDIFNVMKQYESKYRNFKFIGPLPMDFLRLRDQESRYLQRLKLEKLPSYITNLGIIFNIDPSTKGGSHWVALNIDIKRQQIQWFDSYGDKIYHPNLFDLEYQDSHGKTYQHPQKIAIPTEVQKFIAQLLGVKKSKSSSRKIGGSSNKTGFKIKVNTVQHQYANSECGIYSMLFLIKSLNQSFENITQDIIMDEKANQYRNILFRRR